MGEDTTEGPSVSAGYVGLAAQWRPCNRCELLCGHFCQHVGVDDVVSVTDTVDAEFALDAVSAGTWGIGQVLAFLEPRCLTGHMGKELPMAQLVLRLVARGCRLSCLFNIKMRIESLRAPVKCRNSAPSMLRVVRSVEGRTDHNILLLGRPSRIIFRAHQHYLFLLVR